MSTASPDPALPKPPLTAATTPTRSGTSSPAISNISAKLRMPRRVETVSSRDRVNNILEEGRRRSLAMEGAVNRGEGGEGRTERDSSAGSPSGGVGRTPGWRSAEGSQAGAHADGRRMSEGESSADEQTSIMRGRGPNGASDVNYLGTGNSQARTRVARSHPTTASIRSGGRIYEQPREGQREHGNENEEDAGQEHESWWAKLLSEYGSIELENKGSVARDHLALERTFLAWLRTSLAFASIGIAITQLFRLNRATAADKDGDPYVHLRQVGKPLGATFLAISIVILFLGFHRYFESQHWIIRGKFPASRGSIAIVVLITLALMVASLMVVVIVEPNAVEKR